MHDHVVCVSFEQDSRRSSSASGIPPPRPGLTGPAGSRRSPGGRSVRPSTPASWPPPFERSCPRRSAPRASWYLPRAPWRSAPPSPAAGSNYPRTSDSRSDTDCFSDQPRTPPGPPRPLPVRPDCPSPADRPPTPPSWKCRTTSLPTSLTDEQSHRRPGPFAPPPPRPAETSPLLRTSPPAHPGSVLESPAVQPLETLPLTTRNGQAVPEQAFSRSMQKQQIRLTSPRCRTPPSQSADTRWAHPGALHKDPGCDVTSPSNDTSTANPATTPPGLRTVFLIPT